ncbi:MAG: Bor family protein [Methylotenera sp.]|nr:Bor family protein [Oligoflexia bacterium]
MIRSPAAVILALALLTASGCATHRITIGADEGGLRPAFEKSQPFFVYGVGQTKRTNAREICDDHGVARVEVKLTALDVILGAVTVGIYTPSTVEIYCSGSGDSSPLASPAPSGKSE